MFSHIYLKQQNGKKKSFNKIDHQIPFIQLPFPTQTAPDITQLLRCTKGWQSPTHIASQTTILTKTRTLLPRVGQFLWKKKTEENDLLLRKTHSKNMINRICLLCSDKFMTSIKNSYFCFSSLVHYFIACHRWDRLGYLTDIVCITLLLYNFKICSYIFIQFDPVRCCRASEQMTLPTNTPRGAQLCRVSVMQTLICITLLSPEKKKRFFVNHPRITIEHTWFQLDNTSVHGFPFPPDPSTTY